MLRWQSSGPPAPTAPLAFPAVVGVCVTHESRQSTLPWDAAGTGRSKLWGQQISYVFFEKCTPRPRCAAAWGRGRHPPPARGAGRASRTRVADHSGFPVAAAVFCAPDTILGHTTPSRRGLFSLKLDRRAATRTLTTGTGVEREKKAPGGRLTAAPCFGSSLSMHCESASRGGEQML